MTPTTTDEVYATIGRFLKETCELRGIAPRLVEAELVFALELTSPEARITFELTEEPIVVYFGDEAPRADASLSMPVEFANSWLLRETTIFGGLDRGDIQAMGPIERLAPPLPILEFAAFPRYRRMIDAVEGDQADPRT